MSKPVQNPNQKLSRTQAHGLALIRPFGPPSPRGEGLARHVVRYFGHLCDMSAATADVNGTFEEFLLSSLCIKFVGHSLAAFCLAGKFDLVAAKRAGVFEDNLATPAHLLLFKLDRVAADAPFLDRYCSTSAALNGSSQFAAIIL